MGWQGWQAIVWGVALVAASPVFGATVDPLADDVDTATEVFDPLEPINRLTFRLNRGFDLVVIEPCVYLYGTVVPQPARTALRRAMANLSAPSVLVNDILQVELRDAFVTAGRFVVNSTFGILGLFDVAERYGMPPHHSDFGQTLALYGMPQGPYLIVPFVGPTTVRDGGGYLVDLMLRPTTWFLTPAVQIWLTPMQEGTVGFAERAAHAVELKLLRQSSVDFYATFRSAYAQARDAAVWRRGPDRRPWTNVQRGLTLLGDGASGR